MTKKYSDEVADDTEYTNMLLFIRRLYDREGNGYITTSTLKEILRALDDKLSNSDLDGIIAEIDTDGSGTVDFDGKFNKKKQIQNSFLKININLYTVVCNKYLSKKIKISVALWQQNLDRVSI